ncbi:MAG: thioredoxin family protein [Propionibacteriaceae bacterium]|nr:thioredoxin family protein [Propionibacteriaceae bacterium]
MKIYKNLSAAALAVIATVSLTACNDPADKMDGTMQPSEGAMDSKDMDGSMKPSEGMSDDKMEGNENHDAMMKPEKYVTHDDWMMHKDAYENTKQVLFFAASWCPDCKAIDKALMADASSIPDGVSVVKVDYDKATDLRKQYGVTMQHTFVQVDDMGKEVAQWSATKPADVLKGLKG